MQGLPSGRGKKGGKPKRKRSRVLSPAATISQSYHSSQFTGCITGGINLPSATSETGSQLSLPPLTHKALAQPQVANSIVPGIPCAPPPLIPAGVPGDRAPVTVNVNPFYVKFIGVHWSSLEFIALHSCGCVAKSVTHTCSASSVLH